MDQRYNNLLRIRIILSMLFLLAVTSFILILYVFRINNDIQVAKEDHLKSLFYVDELRQSSDDLTKMARLYVIRQDTLYLRYFNQILQIRNGEIPRPIDYQDIYWDFLLANGKIPRPAQEAIPLIDLLKSSCQSQEALNYFILAKESSDDLVSIEEEAFNAMVGLFKDSTGVYSILQEPDPEYAVKLLHTKDYLVAKAKIMESIQDFRHVVDNYSINQIESLQTSKNRITMALIFIVGFAILLMAVILFIFFRKRDYIKDSDKVAFDGKLYSLKNVVMESKRSWHLILVTIIFSFLIILGFFLSMQILKEKIEDNLEQSLTTILETTQNNIINWIGDIESEIINIAHQQGFQRILNNIIDQNLSGRDYEIEKFIGQHLTQSSYIGYFIISKNGEVIVSDQEDWLGQSIISLDQDIFFRELQKKESDIVASMPKSSGAFADYNALIKLGHSLFSESNEFKGSIVFLYKPQNRFTNVLQGGRVGSSGESYAFNGYGELISESRFDEDLLKIGLLKEGEKSLLNIKLKDPGADLTKGKEPKQSQESQPFTLMASDALSGYSGKNISGYNDYRGVKVIGTWNWIEKYGFGIATEIDYAEGYNTYLLISKYGLYGVIAFIFLLLLLTAIFILNRLKHSVLHGKIDQQKALLENTLESLTHPFYVIDANNYSILLANSAAKKLSKSDLTTCYALTHQRGESCDSKEDPCPLKVVKETKKPVVLEHTHFDEKGNKRIVEVSGYPIFDAKGDVVQMIEYSIDITDRKKAEQELYAANQRFQAIVDNLADALIIINGKGIVEFYSPSAEKLFQYSQDEIIGEKINMLMPSPHREDHDRYLENYLDTGIAKVIGFEREVDARRKNGSTFPARLMISEVKTASHLFFVGLVGDLSERKLAEKQLRTQATAMESAENAIVITDPDGYIQWVNPSFTKLTGFESKEVVGRLPNVLKSGKHEEAFYKQMWDTILEGKVWKGEIINKKKDGVLYYEEMTITPVFDHEDKIAQFVAIKQDISERKSLEEIMLKAKKRMEEELNVAKEIQMSMLPLIFPAFPQRKELDVFAKLIPAREVGGDFYDFYFLDENHFCFVVGDVSGKGVPAALMMAVTKTLLKSRAGTDLSTASILTHVNNEIAKDNDAYMFITIFLAILNTNTGELVYSNAGHNPSYIVNKDKKKFTKLSDLHGPVVGAMEDMTYKETRLVVEKDDIIFAYTDGVTESQNSNGELYSDPRLELLLKKSKYKTSKELIENVIEDVKKHEQNAGQFDDITALCVTVCQEPRMDDSSAINIEIRNKLNEITSAVEQFEAFAMENKVSLNVIQKLNIVFDELLNNVISYAYKDEKEHIISINAGLRGERLVVTISDDGEPFNPFGKNPPDTMLSLEERSVGGLGIHLVKNLMDEYDYKRNVNKNIITLVKNNVNS